jgi:hypothetical protein
VPCEAVPITVALASVASWTANTPHAAGGAADQDGVAGSQADRLQSGGGGEARWWKSGCHFAAGAARRVKQRVWLRRGPS